MSLSGSIRLETVMSKEREEDETNVERWSKEEHTPKATNGNENSIPEHDACSTVVVSDLIIISHICNICIL